MSPSPHRRRRGTGWKPPRDRHEVIVAVLASLAVVVVTAVAGVVRSARTT